MVGSQWMLENVVCPVMADEKFFSPRSWLKGVIKSHRDTRFERTAISSSALTSPSTFANSCSANTDILQRLPYTTLSNIAYTYNPSRCASM